MSAQHDDNDIEERCSTCGMHTLRGVNVPIPASAFYRCRWCGAEHPPLNDWLQERKARMKRLTAQARGGTDG